MVEYNKKSKEHAFVTISDDIKKGEISNLLIFSGVEDYLKSWAIEVLTEKYVNQATKVMDMIVFEAGEFDMGKFVEACETVPMFSERKMVVVKDFTPIWGKRIKKVFEESHKKQFLKFINEIPKTTLLVITVGKPEDYKAKKFGTEMSKALEKVGKVYDFEPLDEKQLLGFIKKRLKAAGKTGSRNVMEMLISESGYYNEAIDYALYNLDNDLKKMIAICKDTEIAEEDVISSISDNIEHSTFKMLDAICNDRKPEAFRLLRELMVSGVSEFKILASVVGQLELMLEVKEMEKRERMNVNQMHQVLKVHKFRIQKALGFSSKYSEKQLKRILIAAFSVEKNIKTGILKGNMALEMLIASI